jgi:hypothetical protein
LVRPNSAERNRLWEQIKMTDLQFIRLLKYALKPNKKGNKASIINALELVEIFKDKVIEDYLKEAKSIRNKKKHDTKRNYTKTTGQI